MISAPGIRGRCCYKSGAGRALAQFLGGGRFSPIVFTDFRQALDPVAGGYVCGRVRQVVAPQVMVDTGGSVVAPTARVAESGCGRAGETKPACSSAQSAFAAQKPDTTPLVVSLPLD